MLVQYHLKRQLIYTFGFKHINCFVQHLLGHCGGNKGKGKSSAPSSSQLGSQVEFVKGRDDVIQCRMTDT